MPSSLRRINLNHLTVLHELLQTCNVSRAAVNLHLGQSTVSGILAQLRDTFDDGLLVQSGRRMKRTRRAEELMEPLARALGEIESLVTNDEFDPLIAAGRFTIGTGLISILPRLTALLSSRAPNIHMQALTPVRDSFAQLISGELDMLVAPPGLVQRGDVEDAFLYSDRLMCLTARDNRSVRERLGKSAYSKTPHLAYRVDTDIPVAARFSLPGVPQPETVRAFVPSLPVLPFMIGASDCIGVVPRQIAVPLMAAAGVREVELSFKLPNQKMHLYWSRGKAHDPLQAFARALVMEVGASIQRFTGY
jgi:LysR family nod box-dependent transcriptional activator